MKKSLLVIVALSFLVSYPLESQRVVLNKVKNAFTKEILGTNNEDSNSSKTGPEPSSARDDAKVIADLSEFKLDYNEITICEKEDGSILIKSRVTGKYFLAKDGKSEPLKENDPRVTECFDATQGLPDIQDSEGWAERYPSYITKSGDKYMLKFNGNNFGPYAIISDFAVSRSKDKFAALVTENVMMTQDQSKKMEAEMAKAKSDQERLEISMKYSQQAMSVVMQPGAEESLQPKLVSNVPGATYDAMKWMGGRLNSRVKYDDIVVVVWDKIIDLKGNTLISLSQNSSNYKDLFLNSTGTKYATYQYGTLTFSDNTTLSDLFNPRVAKTDGKIYLNYMYYSPGKNAIMQAAIPF